MKSDSDPSRTEGNEAEQADDILRDLLAEMEPETRELVSSYLAIQQRVGPASDLLQAQINEKNMARYLDIVERGVSQAHEFRLGELGLRKSEQNLRKSNRMYYLAYFLVSVAILALAVVYLLPGHQDFLSQILQILVAFAGGIGIGHGLRLRR